MDNRVKDAKKIIVTDFAEFYKDDFEKKNFNIETFIRKNKIAQNNLFQDIRNQILRKYAQSENICKEIEDMAEEDFNDFVYVNTPSKEEVAINIFEYKNEFLECLKGGFLNNKKLNDNNLINFDNVKESSLDSINFGIVFNDLKKQTKVFKKPSEIIDGFMTKTKNLSLDISHVGHLVEYIIDNKKINSKDDLISFVNKLSEFINKKVSFPENGDHRSLYNTSVNKLFKKVCECLKSINSIQDGLDYETFRCFVSLFDSCIRKQDEAFRLGELIESLNELCKGYSIKINSDAPQNEKKT